MTEVPFVERRFELDGGKLVVCFFTPSKAPGGEFQCRYVIGWPEREVRRYACGLDGLQALMFVNRRPNGTPYRRAKGTPCQDCARLM